VLAGNLGTVAGVTDFAVYVVFLAVNATVIILRFTAADTPRQFRSAPTISRVPIPPVIGLAVTALMLTQLDGTSIAIGSVLVALGLVASAILSRVGRRRDHDQRRPSAGQ
jgi:APA family basic amino acid/polyamine antiporter